VRVLLHSEAFALLAASLFQRGALGSVTVDAAFGEVVGAGARDDEDAPAVAYGTDLLGGRVVRDGV